MKIAYVSSLGMTGPSRHMLDLAEHVARLGHDVEVIVGAEDVSEEAERLGLTVRKVPLRHKFDVRGARSLAPALRSLDVVHSHDRRAGLFARMAVRGHRAVAVHTFHGLPDELAIEVGRGVPPPRLAGTSVAQQMRARHVTVRAERWLSRLGTTVVPSRALQGWLAAHGFPADRMVVIPYGVDVLQDPWPVDHDPPRFATAAYLDQRKAVDVLVEAAGHTKAPLRLDIYGEGPARASLEARARALGVETVFHGFVADFRARRVDYDVFVLSTRGDNLPVAILEAMAAAAPVIATRVGGIPEQVLDGETGLLVPPDDPHALAEAMDRLAGDSYLRRSMGLAGRARIATVFDPRRVASEMTSLYEWLVKRA